MHLKVVLNLLMLFFLCSVAPSSFAESSVWKVSKGEKYFYLGGTIHLLNPQDYPLPIEFTNAYHQADKIIFEVDPQKANMPESQQLFASAMMVKPGHSLQESLKPESYEQLSRFLQARGIPVENFSQFKPWAVTLTISLLEYQRMGMLPQYGVEAFFDHQARSDKKPVGELETISEQISYLQSMEQIDSNVLVSFTLEDLAGLPGFVSTMKSAWRKGDIEVLTSNNMIKNMKRDFPDFYKTLVSDRNLRWMKDLEAYARSEEVEFVLVGTLHLYDEDGLLNLLRKAGYQVSQL